MKKRLFTFGGVHLALVALVVCGSLLAPNLISKACDDGASIFGCHRGDGECGHRCWGWIDLWNNGNDCTSGLLIEIIVQFLDGDGEWCDVLSRSVDLGKYDVLAPGESHSYFYEFNCDLPELKENGALMRSVAHVTISNHSGHQFDWGGFGPSLDGYFYFQ